MDVFHERADLLPPPPPPTTSIRTAAVAAAVEAGDASKLNVIIFNCGLLRVKMPFVGTLFSNPPCVDQRFPFLAGGTASSRTAHDKQRSCPSCTAAFTVSRSLTLCIFYYCPIHSSFLLTPTPASFECQRRRYSLPSGDLRGSSRSGPPRWDA